MQPLLVVIPFDELLHVSPQVFEIRALVGIDFLPLQGLDETLAAGVVARIRRPAHARNRALAGQDRDIFRRGIRTPQSE